MQGLGHSASELRAAGTPAVTNALLGHLVRSLLPPEPALPLETRTEVESATVGFVAAQARAMPAFVRVPFSIALIAFEWLAIGRYGRRAFLFGGLAGRGSHGG